MSVFLNKTAVNYPVDVLTFGPGNDGRKSIVRWLAPAAGTYQVTGRFEGIAVMVDRRFFPIRWPTQEEHIETGGMIQQAVLLKKVQRQVGQTALRW